VTSIQPGTLTGAWSFEGGTFPGSGGTCGTTLTGGSSCTVVVKVAPGSVGAYSASLTIGFFDGSKSQSVTFSLAATAIAAPPTITVAEGSGQNTLTWSASAGATSYNLYWGTSPGVTIGSTVISGVSSPYVHLGLTNGTTYYYSVTAMTDTDESDLSNEVSSAPLGIPSGLIATAGTDQVSLSWTALAGATDYKIFWNTTGGVTTSDTMIPASSFPYVHTGLTPGTTYYYRIAGHETSGTSGLSTEVSVVPSAPAPTGVSGTVGDGQIRISWTAAAGASAYNLYYATSAGVTTSSTQVAAITSPYTLTGLSNGTTYYFAVTSVAGPTESALSTIVSGTPVTSLLAPATVSVTPGANQNAITFSSVVGSANYHLYWKTSAGVTYSDSQLLATSSPYTQSGLTPGTIYYYRVAGIGPGGDGPLSTEASGKVLPDVPTGVSATPGDGQNTIRWSSVAGATSYDLYFSTTSPVTTASSRLSGVTSPNFQNSLTNGTTYYYAVTAVANGAESGLSSQVSGTPGSSLVAPTSVSVTPGAGQTSVSWGSVSGALSYNLYWNTTGGVTTSSTKISGVTSSYIHTLLTPGTTYYYKVVGVGSGGEGPLSSEVSATVEALAPTSLVATPGDGQLGISWTNATGATSYNLYYSTIPTVTTSSTQVVGVTSPYSLTGLTNGTTYYFKLTSVVSGAEGPLSIMQSGTPATSLSAPIVTVTPGANQNSIAFSSLGVSSYHLYWKTSSGVTTSDSQLTASSSPYIQASLTPGTTYYYKVAGVGVGGEGPLSLEASGMVLPAAPTGVGATAGDGQNTITWSAVPGANSYNLYSSTTSPVTTSSTKTSGVSSGYVQSSLSNGTIYYYAVTAVQNGAESVLSSQTNATPATGISAPGLVTATPGVAQVSVSWSAVIGATSYNLYWNTSGGVTTGATKITGVTSAYLHTSLTPGTTYYYKVAAVDGGGEGPLSGEASATAEAAAPTGLVATPGDGSLAISWTAASGATSYNLYYSTSSTVTTASTKVPGVTSPYTLTSLTNGTIYYFKLTSVVAGAEGPLSLVQSGTPATSLLAPTISVTAGVNQNTITFSSLAVSNYHIYWKTSSGVTSSDSQITTSSSPYVHTSLTPGTTYYYKVAGVGVGGDGALSLEASGLVLPAAPAGVGATAGDGQNTVSWSSVAGASSYNLYSSTTSPVTLASAKVTGVTSGYVQSSLTNGTTYYYAVTAVAGGAESALSSMVSAVPVTALLAPGSVAASPGVAQTSVSWAAVTGATGYNIYWSTSSGVTTSSTKIPGVSSAYAHTSLTPGTTYYYKVAAFDVGGEGPLSSEVNATVQAAAPTGLAATPGDGSLSISWTGATGGDFL